MFLSENKYDDDDDIHRMILTIIQVVYGIHS